MRKELEWMRSLHDEINDLQALKRRLEALRDAANDAAPPILPMIERRLGEVVPDQYKTRLETLESAFEQKVLPKLPDKVRKRVGSRSPSAEEKATRRIVAFKVMRKSKLVDVGEATHASDERRLHERVSSGPFINRLLASFQDPWALFLVLEYAPCGDLFQAMNYHGLPSRSDATVYAAQVALALGHLHALGYVYRALKPENILLHPHGSAQLADFGMAKRIAFRGGERGGGELVSYRE